MVSDQVKGYAINIAPEGFQCFNDSKQLLLSDVIFCSAGTVFLDQKAIGLPCWMSTAPRPNPEASHTRSKVGLPSDVSGKAKHGAEVRAVFNPAKAFSQAGFQS